MEDFVSNNSNWLNGTSANATWVSSGGVDGGGFITSTGMVADTGFGTIVFRGNAASDASGDAFVGNWLPGGVSVFSAFVRHNASTNLGIFARLDAGAGKAGSSVDFSVAPNTWTQLSVAIVDSPGSFQSFGAGNFTSVFGNIQNIQFAVSPNAALASQTFTFDIDKVSAVPEPGALGLLFAGAAIFGTIRARSLLRRNKVAP